jgi:hypothetical protein
MGEFPYTVASERDLPGERGILRRARVGAGFTIGSLGLATGYTQKDLRAVEAGRARGSRNFWECLEHVLLVPKELLCVRNGLSGTVPGTSLHRRHEDVMRERYSRLPAGERLRLTEAALECLEGD